MSVNNINGFSGRISFSTKNSFFDRDKLTIVNNIKNISNTNVKFNFVSKIFHAFKRLSTLLTISKTGRIGIKNRSDEKDKYSDSIKELNGRMAKCLIEENKVSKNINDKVNELNSSLVNDKNKVEDKLQNMIQIKNKLVTEERKVDHFLSLIENENVSFGSRYSFFNYLNELKRAESFCEQSNNPSDNEFSTTFKHIFEERVSRVKESDINKIYNEIINTYTLNTTFHNNKKNIITELHHNNDNVLDNFPTNTEKEKFLSKINFLVSISESQLALNKEQYKIDNLNRIMHRILNEEEQEAGINYSYSDTKEGWIKKYMNEFYGNKKIERQSIGTDIEGLSGDMVDAGIDADTISIHSSDYDCDISDNNSVLMQKRISTNKEDSVISDDDSISVHSSNYDRDTSDNDYEINSNKIYNNEEMLSDLVSLLESERMSLLENKNSNNLKMAIINILSKFSDLNNIVTESLKLSKDNNNNELMMSLQKIKNFSDMILANEQLNNVEENYSVELNNNPFYSRVKGSLENIAEKFTEIGDLIEGNKDNLNSIKKEIENSLQNILTKVNYFTLAGKKELIDDVLILIEQSISQTDNEMEWDGYISSNNKLENINDDQRWDNNDQEWDNDGLSVSDMEINNGEIKSTEEKIAEFILDNIPLNNGKDISHSDLDIENKNTKEDLDEKIKFPSTLYQMFLNAENLDDKISDDKVSDDKINNEMDNEINNEVNKWLEEYKEK
ncbi:hypothetical protein [Proteus myxofaciens]|nr:hypothetical protein [Proteus myxofaciens]